MSHYPHARLIDEANSVMIALDRMTFPTYMHTSPFSTVKGCVLSKEDGSSRFIPDYIEESHTALKD